MSVKQLPQRGSSGNFGWTFPTVAVLVLPTILKVRVAVDPAGLVDLLLLHDEDPNEAGRGARSSALCRKNLDERMRFYEMSLSDLLTHKMS